MRTVDDADGDELPECKATSQRYQFGKTGVECDEVDVGQSRMSILCACPAARVPRRWGREKRSIAGGSEESIGAWRDEKCIL